LYKRRDSPSRTKPVFVKQRHRAIFKRERARSGRSAWRDRARSSAIGERELDAGTSRSAITPESAITDEAFDETRWIPAGSVTVPLAREFARVFGRSAGYSAGGAYTWKSAVGVVVSAKGSGRTLQQPVHSSTAGWYRDDRRIERWYRAEESLPANRSRRRRLR